MRVWLGVTRTPNQGPDRFRLDGVRLRSAAVDHLIITKTINGDSYRPVNIPASFLASRDEVVRAGDVLVALA